ncbi:MAG: carbohydrate ABC transporter permease, partial [Paracoccaceae bacterium]|nr:carbohydrate ABC transporter permease [Paracoccaceae bacterium]
MTDATVVDVSTDTRKSGRFLYGASVVFLCAWVIVPIYFLLINTLSSPEAVNSFPKSFIPEFD